MRPGLELTPVDPPAPPGGTGPASSRRPWTSLWEARVGLRGRSGDSVETGHCRCALWPGSRRRGIREWRGDRRRFRGDRLAALAASRSGLEQSTDSSGRIIPSRTRATIWRRWRFSGVTAVNAISPNGRDGESRGLRSCRIGWVEPGAREAPAPTGGGSVPHLVCDRRHRDPGGAGSGCRRETICPTCGRSIELAFLQGHADDRDLRAWLPSQDCCTSVIDELCPDINLFCSHEHLEEWRRRAGAPVGTVLP
jgi:alkylmercury lyase-like protein